MTGPVDVRLVELWKLVEAGVLSRDEFDLLKGDLLSGGTGAPVATDAADPSGPSKDVDSQSEVSAGTAGLADDVAEMRRRGLVLAVTLERAGRTGELGVLGGPEWAEVLVGSAPAALGAGRAVLRSVHGTEVVLERRARTWVIVTPASAVGRPTPRATQQPPQPPGSSAASRPRVGVSARWMLGAVAVFVLAAGVWFAARDDSGWSQDQRDHQMATCVANGLTEETCRCLLDSMIAYGAYDELNTLPTGQLRTLVDRWYGGCIRNQ